MAQMFEDEKGFPDNAKRKNFVFLGYPFNPPLAQDDYTAAMKELQEELPVRLWYFLDELTTQELMRKIWRAILRSDLAFFDTTGGNANVAFELGMAVAIDKPCVTLLRTGGPNPLGQADLSYAERVEYTSRETLKEQIRRTLKTKSSALRQLNALSYEIQSAAFPYERVEIENKLVQTLTQVFTQKRATRSSVAKIFGTNDQATIALNPLRQTNILKLEGTRRSATYRFTDEWVYHDHEVVGGA